ncbi:hypothetical protein [Deinococcus sp. ME38]|uniref:hypothetical protein n=1 Tax=Deinococcus sp. ME38 TaxID=3400344 RepID=UPI003B5AA705
MLTARLSAEDLIDQASGQLFDREGAALGAQRGGDVVQQDVEGAHARSWRRCHWLFYTSDADADYSRGSLGSCRRI